MKFNTLLARSAVCAVLTGLVGIASAGETGSNSTEIKLLGKDKKLESLKFEGELPVGESRGLYTDAGTPVTLQRTEKGLRIETPERTVEVPYGDSALDGDKQKHIVVMHADKHHAAHQGKAHAMHHEAHADAHQKRVIVLKDGEIAEGDLDLKLEKLGELGVLDELDIDDADGNKRVVVIHKVEKQSADSAEK